MNNNEVIRKLQKEQIKHLGSTIGFGAMYYLTQECWKEALEEKLGKGHGTGAFAIGPCLAAIVPCFCCDSSEKKYKEFLREGCHCNACCGAGWLTKEVKEIIKRYVAIVEHR